MATKGINTKVGYAAQGANGALSEGPFTHFAKVTEVSGISIESDDIETSHMESPGAADGKPWKEFTAGTADAGEIDLTVQFEKANAATVWGLFRQDKTFEVLFRDGSSWTLNGYVKKFGTEVDREGIITVPITIKASGEPVFEAAA